MVPDPGQHDSNTDKEKSQPSGSPPSQWHHKWFKHTIITPSFHIAHTQAKTKKYLLHRVKYDSRISKATELCAIITLRHMSHKVSYTLDDIKYGTDEATFQRAVKLYQTHKVQNVVDTGFTYTATVQGTSNYHLIADPQKFTCGQCNCYIGQQDELCKHLVALSIHLVKQGQSLTDQDLEIYYHPVCSGSLGVLTSDELSHAKKQITAALRYIKPYTGPSRIWFTYQDGLDQGCYRLSTIVSHLPVSLQTAKLLVNLMLRLDHKLTDGGVDDSNGTVGGCIQDLVQVLNQYIDMDPQCLAACDRLVDIQTCFDWQLDLEKKYLSQQ